MKKTATILALAGLSMAANPEHLHGSFRTRKIVDHKPLKPETLLADDEFQIIRMDGGNSGSYDPRFHPSKPTKPQTGTPPYNPKIWQTPPKKELYADDADDEFQIIRMGGGNSGGNNDPRFQRTPTKPQPWTPPTNPKVWQAPPKKELYADDADDELQIIRMGGGNSGSSDPRFHPSKPTKPQTWTPPTNPKVWQAPPKKELYADDADDELQIIRMDGGNSGSSYIPGVTKYYTNPKPQPWTLPTNPKIWNAPPKKELYADDADDELQIIRMGGGNSGSYDPRVHPSTPIKPWTPPTNPKVWQAPPKKELYADDADDELQIIRDGGYSGSYDPRVHPSTPVKTWTPPTNPKVWNAPPKRELYADDADDELVALAELLLDN